MSISRSRSQNQKLLYQLEGLATSNKYGKYESIISYGKKVMANEKVFCPRSQCRR